MVKTAWVRSYTLIIKSSVTYEHLFVYNIGCGATNRLYPPALVLTISRIQCLLVSMDKIRFFIIRQADFDSEDRGMKKARIEVYMRYTE